MIQKDIANLINIDFTTYSDYENEIVDFSTDRLCTLADFYNVSTDYILYKTDIRICNNKIDRIKKHRLKDLRKSMKLTQKDMAITLHMSQSGYSNYETFTTDIPINVLLLLSDFYKTSIDYILYRTDNPTSYPKSKIKNAY